MRKAHIPNKLKSFFSDVIWSILGLMLMNVVAQFVVYPAWNARLGDEAYGNIVYLLAVMNTIAITLGSGINYARMRSSADGETKNQPYIIFLLCGTALIFPALLFLQRIGSFQLDPREFLLFYLLTVATMWRYYADIEYRLNINYKGYFCYYLLIGAGYLFGIALFRRLALWPLALLPGEIAGVVLVFWRGSILRKDDTGTAPEEWRPILSVVLILIGGSFISQLIFNADRILLKNMVGAGAVTVYYIASLLGKTAALLTAPLSGVLIGYISRYQGELTCRIMNLVTGLSIVGTVLITVACTVASHILIPILYPTVYEGAKSLFVIANMGQVVYFVGSVLISSVLLRFTKTRNQITINGAYGIAFCAVCCPLVAVHGVMGFCAGLLAVNVLRLIVCLAVGYYGAVRGEGDGT